MRFPKIIGRREIVQAAIIGTATGIIGVLLFILMLNSMNSDFIDEQLDGEMIPVTSQNEGEETLAEGTYEQFYANQHGVFSTFDAAMEFVAGYPTLNTSAVVEIGDSFYVWSSINTKKEAVVISDNPSSFVKPFKLSGEGCSEPELKNLPSLLKSNDRSKFYFDSVESPEHLPPDWQKISFALSSLSSDLAVIRMHLLAHYFTENECLKIEF